MEDCKLEIKLEDKPGALSHVLDVIAKNSGNLFAVSHIRERAREGLVPVVIQLQATPADFAAIVKDLEARGIEITEKVVGGAEEVQLTQEFILIGHVIDTDIKDTIYSVCGKDVMIKSLDISLKSLKDPSSVFAEIGAKNNVALNAAMKKLEAVAAAKKLLLITGINNSP
jgi:ACT domain-containing protein